MVQSNSISTVQGWSSVFPKFSAVDFVSFYIEIPVMMVMYTAWVLAKNNSFTKPEAAGSTGELTPLIPIDSRGHATGHPSLFDVVDIYGVDLYKDEYVEDADDELDEEGMKQNLHGRFGWLWRLYYLVV